LIPPEPAAFAEPWHAEVFAMAVALHERGLFTWVEWSAALGRHLSAAGDAATGERYYEHWLSALEELACTIGAATPDELDERSAAWDRAARSTPHGRPIRLPETPEAGAPRG
jgi:nitrile hydratase accessory protein